MGVEYLVKIKKEKGVTTEEISRVSGVPIGTLNKIFSGQTTDPKYETIKAVCAALNISLSELDYFESERDEIAAYAEELHKNPEYRALFDAAKGATKEDMQFAAEMLKRMKKEAGYE